MRCWRAIPTMLLAGLASTVWLQPAMADRYDDAVERAEELWTEGRKTEAVLTYGRIWKLRPDDVDRQILYGRRSAEVGNYRWAINFFKVAESKADDDPSLLYRIYTGYADAYRRAGYASRAEPWEEKAEALRDAGGVADVPPPPPAAVALEPQVAQPPPPPQEPAPIDVSEPPAGVTLVKRPGRYLKKRIAVAPVGAAVGGEGLAAYGNQIQAMLITELRKTDRFIVVERENLEGILAEQDLASTGRAAKGTGPRTGRLLGAQLMVKAEITDFDNQSEEGRRVGVGPVDWGRGRSTVRVAMDMRLYDTETGVVVASEHVAAEKVADSRDVGVSVSAFRWSDSRSQSSTLGQVTRELVNKALEKILAHSEKIPWTASVIKADDEQVYINEGAGADVREGDRFTVLSVGEALTDPDTGEVLTAKKTEIGVIEVTEVAPKYAIAIVRRNTQPIERGDKIVAAKLRAPE